MEAQDSKPVPDATIEEREDIEMQQIIMSPTDSLVLAVSEEEKTKENDKPKDIALDSKTEVESHCLPGSEEEILPSDALSCTMLAKENETVEVTVSSEESSSGTNIATSSKDHDRSQASASGSNSAPSLSHIKSTENEKATKISSSSLNRIIPFIYISDVGEHSINLMIPERAVEEKPNSNSSTSNSEKDEVQNVDSAQDLSNTRDEPNTTSTEPSKCECSETSSASLTNEDAITLSKCTEAESSNEINTVKREEGTSSDISQLAADSKNSGNAASAEVTENETEGRVSTTQPILQELLENNERRAFFYISSSSAPDYQAPDDPVPEQRVSIQFLNSDFPPHSQRPEVVTRQESQEVNQCLGSKRCHYIILAIAVLGAIMGCVTYHLHDMGIGPEALRPIGASTAFISFAVIIISSVYLNYLCHYPMMPVVPNYEILGDIDSAMALARISNTDIYHRSRGGVATSGQIFEVTQSADVLDRRGYGRKSAGSSATEVKRCYSPDPGLRFDLSQPSKKFKTGEQASEESYSGTTESVVSDIEKNIDQDPADGTSNATRQQSDSTREMSNATTELPSEAQSSGEIQASETTPLLPKNTTAQRSDSAQENPHETPGLPSDGQSTEEIEATETTPLLPKK